MLKSLQNYNGNEIAVKRLEIIKFYDKYGEEATKDAYRADRKIISKWKKKMKESGGKLESLIPKSTAPRNKRVSSTDSRIGNIY